MRRKNFQKRHIDISIKKNGDECCEFLRTTVQNIPIPNLPGKNVATSFSLFQECNSIDTDIYVQYVHKRTKRYASCFFKNFEVAGLSNNHNFLLDTLNLRLKELNNFKQIRF